MRRFLVQSILLHGIVLMLLFSWENPLAGKITLRNIIQVSLVEKGEDEPPPAKPEKAAGKPKEEKRIAKLAPPPPVRPAQTKQEVREEAPVTVSPQKDPAPQAAPDFSAVEDEPVPGPPGSGAFQPAVSSAGESAEGAEKGRSAPGAGGKDGAVLMASLNPGPAKEEIAAGGGGGKQTGIFGGEGGNAADPVLAQIIRKIEEAKRYPRAARRMGIEGKTVVRFKLKPGGQVEAAEVAESSGSDILDEASLKTVREAAPLPYKDGWLKVGIVFKIL